MYSCSTRLPAAQFTPIKDQRQTVNRWNRYVLGDNYIKEAAKLHPKSKEWGPALLEVVVLTLTEIQREGSPANHI